MPWTIGSWQEIYNTMINLEETFAYFIYDQEVSKLSHTIMGNKNLDCGFHDENMVRDITEERKENGKI